MTVESGSLQINFGTSAIEIDSIRTAARGRESGGDLEGVEICSRGSQEMLVRASGQVSEPIFLRDVESFHVDGGAARFKLWDERREYWADVEIGPSANGLRFGCRVEGPQPAWMVEWQLRGLELDEIIIPALGGQSVTADMPSGSRLDYKYPFWWNAQFAIGMTAPDRGIWWRTLETEPRFRLLRIARRNSLFDVTIGFEADAPLTKGPLEGEFFLDAFEGSWKVPADVHRSWLEQAFQLVPSTNHKSFPLWARDISLILELWGMRKDRGRPAHTFADMVDRIEAFARRHPPPETLLYLPGFAEGGIDSHIPDYAPSPKLGGSDGFARLVERAHELGYRVMIHTNVLGMTFNHPRYPEFEKHQVVDVFGRPQGWGLDLDGDWLAEPYFAYINPGAPAWGDLMAEVLGQLISRFDLDAVFLDQTLLAFNVSRGPNFVSGMRAHVERLQRAFPSVLFAGEGINEHVLPVLPMVQIHGIDSIAGVHGMEEATSWRRVHPVSTYLFGPYTRFVAHLLTKHPSDPVFSRQEAAYADLGVVPALVCYGTDHELAGPEIDAVLDRARRLTDAHRNRTVPA